MELRSLLDAITDHALEYCREKVHYSEQLSLHGSVTAITDGATVIDFFSRNGAQNNKALGQ